MSGPAALPPIPPNIAKLTGPLIVGELLGTYLFGILTVQFYLYHLNFPKDPNYIKYLVWTVFILDLASTVMCISDAWHWFASGYGNLLFLGDIWLSAFDTPMLGAIIAAIVQCFYVYRLWTLNKYTLPVCVLVIGLAIAQVISGIYGAVVGHIAETFAAAAPKVRSATWVVNIGAAVADVLIMVTMSVLLLRSRSKEHARTDFIVRKIINLTVETNLLSSTLAVLTVILLVGVPNTNYFTAPSILLGRIYSNSLLLILNNRKYLTFQDNVVASTTAASDSTGRTMTWRPASRKVTTMTTDSRDISFRGTSSMEMSTMAIKRDDTLV